jgi:D-amino-acid dehydrogenase
VAPRELVVTRTVIVGAGVVGLSCAYMLRKRGEDVVLLDQAAPGSGCSRGNAGWIVPSLAEPLPAPGLTWTSLRWMLDRDSPLHIAPAALPELAGWLWVFWRHCNERAYKAGRAAWARLVDGIMGALDDLAADGVDFEMHKSGLLFVFLSEAAMRHALRTAADTSVEPPRVLTGGDLRQLEPSLSKAVVAGFLMEHERHVRPESLCSALIARAREMGVEIHSATDVTGGVIEGDTLRAVRTAAGDIVADRCLIAAGARSGAVSRSVAGVPLPVQAGKGYALTMAGRPSPFSRPLYLDEARLGCSPFANGYRFAGTMELSGINERLVPDRVAAIRRAARRYLTLSSEDEGGVEWVGMRPLTPDGVPLIGRVPGHRNVFIATGHGMLGVTSALTTAASIADLITTGRATLDLTPFDPARFH